MIILITIMGILIAYLFICVKRSQENQTSILGLIKDVLDINRELAEQVKVVDAANTMMNMKINRLEEKQLKTEFLNAEESCKEA